ncbi:MAG: hypothetical protein U1F71_17035 [Verrucomicrobiaceae bacterium]
MNTRSCPSWSQGAVFLPSSWHVCAFGFASFGSIALLLGQLYRCGSMNRLFWVVGLPCIVIMACSWWRGVKAGDTEFLLRLKAGLVGGLLGTLGYDLVRIPLHCMGLNPLTPIRHYGVWITGGDHSTWLTDLAGLAYHFSNGITFAWMYALAACRRHGAWAVVWALVLETLAVFCVFGEVFAIRTAYDVLTVAYAAHLFYGAPLGWACRRPEQALAWFQPLARRGGAWMTGLGMLALALWFPFAWQPSAPNHTNKPGEVAVGPDAIRPGILDLNAGSIVMLRNEAPEPVKLIHRRPGKRAVAVDEILLETQGTHPLRLQDSGIHQLLAPGRPWRSIFISVQSNGDYRPR